MKERRCREEDPARRHPADRNRHTGPCGPGGAHLESLIACDLFAWRETRPRRPNILFWRTSKGAEVDFVVETPREVIPVGVRSSRSVRLADARHLDIFIAEYPDQARAAVLLYAGRETYWLNERVLAVPWPAII